MQLDAAAAFFKTAAQRYAGCEHVIYEIWNEPLDVSWDTIKSYAERIIAEIRAHDQHNLIVVGTPRWSQAVDEAADAPLLFASWRNAEEARAALADEHVRGWCGWTLRFDDSGQETRGGGSAAAAAKKMA